jgi:hypothetical protein
MPGASPSLTHTPCKDCNGLLEIALFVHPVSDVDIIRNRKMTLDILDIFPLTIKSCDALQPQATNKDKNQV